MAPWFSCISLCAMCRLRCPFDSALAAICLLRCFLAFRCGPVAAYTCNLTMPLCLPRCYHVSFCWSGAACSAHLPPPWSFPVASFVSMRLLVEQRHLHMHVCTALFFVFWLCCFHTPPCGAGAVYNVNLTPPLWLFVWFSYAPLWAGCRLQCSFDI